MAKNAEVFLNLIMPKDSIVELFDLPGYNYTGTFTMIFNINILDLPGYNYTGTFTMISNINIFDLPGYNYP